MPQETREIQKTGTLRVRNPESRTYCGGCSVGEQTVKLAMEERFTEEHSPGRRALSMWNGSQERCYQGGCKKHEESKPAAMVQLLLQMAAEEQSAAREDPFTLGHNADCAECVCGRPGSIPLLVKC